MSNKEREANDAMKKEKRREELLFIIHSMIEVINADIPLEATKISVELLESGEVSPHALANLIKTLKSQKNKEKEEEERSFV